MQRLSIIILFLAAPIVLLKIMWFPATIAAFFDVLQEFEIDGTIQYAADRDRRFFRLIWALLLYLLGFSALLGVSVATFLRSFSGLIQRFSLICIIIVGIALPFFEASRIGSDTDWIYVFIMICLPIIIVTVSLMGLIYSRLGHNKGSETPNNTQ